MNDLYFKISCIQRKKDKAVATQRIMRFALKVYVAVFIFLELVNPDVIFLFASGIFVIFFFIDAYNVKNVKAYEIQIYHLHVEMLDLKKEVADIIGRDLPEYLKEKEIKRPDEEIKLPILRYLICIVIQLAVGIICLY